MQQVLSWPEAFAAGVPRSGGKGWNLARLARYGFPVSDGFVIEATAYRDALAPHHAIVEEAGRITDATAPGADALLARLRAGIEAMTLPSPLRDAIAGALTDHNLDRVAVRSSAVAEDGAEASFAGMHRSFLGVRGLEDIERAVVGCWASLWTPHAVAYRRKMNVSDEDAACAVVICAMVGDPEPQCAGVAFSADPQTGRQSVVVVDAAPGIGENVVSGRVNPDRFVVRIGTSGELEPESYVGRAPALLDEAQRRSLALLIWRIHWALGGGQQPQDVEWAFDGASFWILQSRPVTKLPHFTFRGAETLPVIWSTANIKDAVPGVYSMLGWSLLRSTIDSVLYASLDAAGHPAPHGLESVRRFDGRGYFDLTGVEWALYDLLGILPAETNKAVGGHQPEIPVPSAKPLEGPDAKRRKLAMRKMLWRLLRIRREFSRVMPPYFAALKRAMQIDVTKLSNRELLAVLTDFIAHHRDVDPLVGLSNSASGPLLLGLGQLMKRIAPEDGEGLAARLLTGAGSITSADHGYALHDLAGIARRDAAALAWLRSDAAATTWESLPSDSPFRIGLRKFLDEYGHRSVYEGDVMNPRWSEDPSFLVDQLRIFVEQPESDPRLLARRVNEDAWRELGRRTLVWRPVVRWLVNRARKASAMREEAKSALVASVPPTRRIALEVGRRLVRAGHLDKPEDIFHLSLFDFRALLEEEWDGRGAREIAHDHAAQREAWLKLSDPADVIIEEKGGASLVLPDVPEAFDGEQWRGIAVSGGNVTAIARVVLHPDEGRRLGTGEVLVAPSTDPGWTPLFLRASAIVMETGGYLSHGAVVAREYGIPAVVNIPGILETLQDGETIAVDGNRGIVRRA